MQQKQNWTSETTSNYKALPSKENNQKSEKAIDRMGECICKLHISKIYKDHLQLKQKLIT